MGLQVLVTAGLLWALLAPFEFRIRWLERQSNVSKFHAGFRDTRLFECTVPRTKSIYIGGGSDLVTVNYLLKCRAGGVPHRGLAYPRDTTGRAAARAGSELAGKVSRTMGEFVEKGPANYRPPINADERGSENNRIPAFIGVHRRLAACRAAGWIGVLRRGFGNRISAPRRWRAP